MKIIVAKTAGFCMGVKRAVDLALRIHQDHPKDKDLSPLIHNSRQSRCCANEE
jgi:4-hydroxy-3-methylbut-2-enyl diphosphate reductase IspH